VTEVRAHGSGTPVDVSLVVVIENVDVFSSLHIYGSLLGSVSRGPSVDLSSSNSFLDLIFRPLSTLVVSHIDGSSGVILEVQFRDSGDSVRGIVIEVGGEDLVGEESSGADEFV